MTEKGTETVMGVNHSKMEGRVDPETQVADIMEDSGDLAAVVLGGTTVLIVVAVQVGIAVAKAGPGQVKDVEVAAVLITTEKTRIIKPVCRQVTGRLSSQVPRK